MNKTMIVAALLAAGAASGAQAQMPDPFGDGTVTKADAQAQVDARFAELDTDKDGVIGPAELEVAAGQRGGRMLARADADGDGKVSKAELQAMQDDRFDRMDTNKDGQLTKEERDAARAAMRSRMGGGGGNWGGSDRAGPPPGEGPGGDGHEGH